MGERKGMKGLELWCKKMTEGYPGVKIENMTTSWRDGLAFCAIIHHFRPDLIDFDKLNKDDVYHNNELAFRVAEHHLGIPALLEAEDMVEYEVPDRLSILTYLSQFYQAFEVTRGKSGARIAPKRAQSSPDHGIVSPTSTSPPTKIAITNVGRARREPCAKCGLPVFIAERLNVGKLLYHRTCFRCARCNSQLTLANYYETENEEFCCEICPDEEKQISKKISPEHSVLTRSMSDEEKSDILQNKLDMLDAYSTHFETALEFPIDGELKKNFTLTTASSSEYSIARSQFFKSQIENSTSGSTSEDDIPPDLPKTTPPPVSASGSFLSKNLSVNSDSGFPNNKHDSSSNSSISVSKKADDDFVTKDNSFSSIGLVSARMKLFETSKDIKKSETIKEVPSASSQRKVAAVITMHDLEDFDNISKKDVEIDGGLIYNENISGRRLPDSAASQTKSNISKETCFVDQIISQHELDEKLIENNTNSNNSTNETKFVNREREEKLSIVASIVQRETSFVGQGIMQVRDDIELQDSNQDNEDEAKGELGGTNEDINVSARKDISDSVRHILSSSDSVIEVLDSSEEKSTRIVEQSLHFPASNDTVVSISDDSDLSTRGEVFCKTNNSSDQISKMIRSESALPLETSLVSDNSNTSVIEQTPEKQSQKDTQASPSVCLPEGPKYPKVLNPFGDEEEEAQIEPFTPVAAVRPKKKIHPNSIERDIARELYTERISLNPFGEEEEAQIEPHTPVAAVRPKKKIHPNSIERDIARELYTERISLNPFGEEEEVQIEPFTPAPAVRQKKNIQPNYIGGDLRGELCSERNNLNPFEDCQFEEDVVATKPVASPRRRKKITNLGETSNINPFESDDEENIVPVLAGKTSRTSHLSPPACHQEPKVRDNLSVTSKGSHGGSNSSISSGSAIGSARKKKPAPRPPIPFPVTTTRNITHRKSKRAPPPPITSTPAVNKQDFDNNRRSEVLLSPVAGENNSLSLVNNTEEKEEGAELEKIVKDEENRNRQSQQFENVQIPTYGENLAVPNKSTYGKWKRRKGQAPARPIPERRIIKSLPMSEIRRELDTIEIQQQGLEKQGVRLEQIIRDKCEGNGTFNSDDTIPIDVEDLILQLFELVNEKNELFRRQAELMYLRRQQRLEEEHADVEYQIRCLMMQPEANKTDFDKTREEALINRLIEIVERRNEIIECLEMDRVREAEEDDSIHSQLNLYSLKRESEKETRNLESENKSKKDKKHRKEKRFKIHLHRHKEKGQKIDVDKDVDESEISTYTLEKKSKKKFNLF
ncbi:F-actin-monooxygenase MICAL3 [Cylas formicarius]|uniref:F-actin-monooxygenase MICAL3 n=1 Tax=Cylas formicarius TaxID=197179 RepID=UPI00295846BE|nr:F-actin-monooxygenase MICAL3 [Cylas formicarius]